MTTVGGDVRQRGSEVSWFFYALGGEYDGQSDHDGGRTKCQPDKMPT